MTVLESLKAGRFGIELHLPSNLEVHQDKATSAQLIDKAKNLAWFFFLQPDLHLDLSKTHREDMRKSIEYYARSMFEDVFHQLNHLDPERPPRTADAAWSPLIDVDYSRIGGVEALRTIHRMAYEPTKEMIMGHILIPLQKGLFEARVLCIDELTGYRESLLVAKWLEERSSSADEDMDQIMASFRQADYDDPRHDELFSEHSLSRARAALRWLEMESNIRVIEPPRALAHGEVKVPHLRCAIVPPPRFAYDASAESPKSAGFRRVSFCATDGLESFVVDRWNGSPRARVTNLRKEAESIAREVHEKSGVHDAYLDVESRTSPSKQPQLLIIVEGQGHQGLLRNAMLFFHDEHQRTWSLSRMGTAAVPGEVLAAELEQAAATFRLFRGPKKEPKPWWKFW